MSRKVEGRSELQVGTEHVALYKGISNHMM